MTRVVKATCTYVCMYVCLSVCISVCRMHTTMYLTRVVKATGFAPLPRNIEGRRPSTACHKKKIHSSQCPRTFQKRKFSKVNALVHLYNTHYMEDFCEHRSRNATFRRWLLVHLLYEITIFLKKGTFQDMMPRNATFRRWLLINPGLTFAVPVVN